MTLLLVVALAVMAWFLVALVTVSWCVAAADQWDSEEDY